MPYTLRVGPRWAGANPDKHMKNTIILAVSLGVTIAAAALLLSFRSLFTAESLIGYLSVFALIGMATLEYRINWRRLFGRS
jgi:hypothetical protein